MQSKIEQFLRVPLILVSIVAWGFVVVGGLVLAFQRFEIIGKTANLGDVLTLGSLMSAIVLAGIGWLFVWSREKAERERIAKADAVILYRRLSSTANFGVAVLIYFTANKHGNLLDRFPSFNGEDQEELNKIFNWFHNLGTHILPKLPDTDRCFECVHSLYVHDIEFGNLFMEALLSTVEFRRDFLKYIEVDPAKRAAGFSARIKMEVGGFADLVASAARVCVCLEKARVELGSIEFEPEPSSIHFLGYCKSLYETLGKENPFSNSKNISQNDLQIDPEVYAEVFQTTLDFAEDLKNKSGFNLYGA